MIDELNEWAREHGFYDELRASVKKARKENSMNERFERACDCDILKKLDNREDEIRRLNGIIEEQNEAINGLRLAREKNENEKSILRGECKKYKSLAGGNIVSEIAATWTLINTAKESIAKIHEETGMLLKLIDSVMALRRDE